MVGNQQRHTLSKAWSTMRYQQWDKNDCIVALIDKWTMLFFQLSRYILRRINYMQWNWKNRFFMWTRYNGFGTIYFLPHNPGGIIETSSCLLFLPLSSYHWTVHFIYLQCFSLSYTIGNIHGMLDQIFSLVFILLQSKSDLMHSSLNILVPKNCVYITRTLYTYIILENFSVNMI